MDKEYRSPYYLSKEQFMINSALQSEVNRAISTVLAVNAKSTEAPVQFLIDSYTKKYKKTKKGDEFENASEADSELIRKFKDLVERPNKIKEKQKA